MNGDTTRTAMLIERAFRGAALLLMAALALGGPVAAGQAWADDGGAGTSASQDDGHDADGKSTSGGHHGPELTDEPVPLLLDDDLPKRTPPIAEIGTPLLGPGKLRRGFELPTGAVWTPALWIYGSYRTSFNYVDPGSDDDDELLEWPHRLDLIFNLQLSGTERLVLGLQPLHRDGRFTNYTYLPEDQRGWTSEANLDVATFFFEGDLAEIFQKSDPMDSKGLDYGFAIGRQLIEFQGGIMFNDLIDSVGVVRNHMWSPGISKIRATVLFGWGNIHRGDGQKDNDARLIAVLTEMDTVKTTWEFDVAYTDSDLRPDFGGDGLYLGAGATQRFGTINTTFRVNASLALDEPTDSVDDGMLVTAQVSTSPGASHNVFYTNAFWGIERYTSAARDPTTGGPLGSIGLLFGAVGLGRWPPALGNRVDDSWGIAAGYQWFWDTDRTQLVIEAGGRQSTTVEGQDAVAIGSRIQRKLGRRFLVQFDGYVTKPRDDDARFGLRSELRINF